MDQEVFISGKKTIITNENFSDYFEINSIKGLNNTHDISCGNCFFVRTDSKGNARCSNRLICEVMPDSYYKLKNVYVLKGKKIKLIIK